MCPSLYGYGSLAAFSLSSIDTSSFPFLRSSQKGALCHQAMFFSSYPILSYPILSHPILSYLSLTYPISAYPILSHPILSYLSLTYPISA